jgi:uncharacterized membrane protein
MYAVLIGLIIAFHNDQIRYTTYYYLFYLLAMICCLVALVLIRQDWLFRKDRTMLLLTFLVNVFTMTQI